MESLNIPWCTSFKKESYDNIYTWIIEQEIEQKLLEMIKAALLNDKIKILKNEIQFWRTTKRKFIKLTQLQVIQFLYHKDNNTYIMFTLDPRNKIFLGNKFVLKNDRSYSLIMNKMYFFSTQHTNTWLTRNRRYKTENSNKKSIYTSE